MQERLLADRDAQPAPRHSVPSDSANRATPASELGACGRQNSGSLPGDLTAMQPPVAAGGGSFRCGHSACSGHFIETGDPACIEDDNIRLGEDSRAARTSSAGSESQTCMGMDEGSGPAGFSPTDDDDGLGMGEVAWLVGLALVIATVCGCYLLAAAVWGPA